MRALFLTSLVLIGSSALANGNYPVIRWVIEGDTQSYTDAAEFSPHPNPWDDAHAWLCANATAKNLQGIIATGDIVYRYGSFGADLPAPQRAEELVADHAYDITDACGLEAILPAGNHDFYGTCGANPPPYTAPGCAPPPNTADRYLGFLATRPMHDPATAARSASGLSWVQGLAANVQILVLPYQADATEEAWAQAKIAASALTARFFIIQHEAIDPAQPGVIPTSTAAGRLAALFGQAKVPMVMGGHFFPADRVQTWLNAAGQRALMVNFQESDPLTSAPFWGWLVWLEYSTASGQWCLFDQNVLTGQRNRFQPDTCWVP